MATKNNEYWSLGIGIVAMVLLLIAVFSEPASLLQKTLFVIGALILTLVAYMNKQKMLSVLQVILSLGSVLAFIEIGILARYALLLGAAIVGIGYLVLTKNYKSDRWGIVCSIGLLLLAAGFATDANAYPIYFGILLGAGSLLVAFYSFADYMYNKNKVAIIWIILNIVFAVNPILILVRAYGG